MKAKRCLKVAKRSGDQLQHPKYTRFPKYLKKFQRKILMLIKNVMRHPPRYPALCLQKDAVNAFPHMRLISALRLQVSNVVNNLKTSNIVWNIFFKIIKK